MDIRVQLGALVEVGHSRAGALEQRPREADRALGGGELVDEPLQQRVDGGVRQDAVRERVDRGFVGGVRLEPARPLCGSTIVRAAAAHGAEG